LARNDNFIVLLKYEDGSLCTLKYTALGNDLYPKESMEIFVNGFVITMNDFKIASVFGADSRGWTSGVAKKGLIQELSYLADVCMNPAKWSVNIEEQILAARISFNVERAVNIS
jgi:hypothetical protein